MYHMIRPTFPGYAAYPYQGPRLMSRIEGFGSLVPPATAALEGAQAGLSFDVGVGRDLVVKLAVRHLVAGAAGVGVAAFKAKGVRKTRETAGYIAVSQGLAALSGALFPPEELAQVEVTSGPNNVTALRVVPVTLTAGTRVAFAATGALLTALGAWLLLR